jgi:hypothetical protein
MAQWQLFGCPLDATYTKDTIYVQQGNQCAV